MLIPKTNASPEENVVDNRSNKRSKKKMGLILAMPLLMAALATFPTARSFAEQPPLPCHSNPNAVTDEATLRARGDVALLPGPLQDRLAQLASGLD